MTAPAATRRSLLIGLLTGTIALTPLVGGCSSGGAHVGGEATGPRPLTTDEADRLAIARLSLYRSKVLAIAATIGSAGQVITISGWLDAVNNEGYALIAPRGGQPFLSIWDATRVSAQSYAGAQAPLPHPTNGWDTADLSANDSVLAAAQVLLVSLSSDRADNPQLLLQNGAQWVRSDTVNGTRVDVINGPLATGATVSNLRYWVSDKGQLLRLEARLDGKSWSEFDLTPAPGVTF